MGLINTIWCWCQICTYHSIALECVHLVTVGWKETETKIQIWNLKGQVMRQSPEQYRTLSITQQICRLSSTVSLPSNHPPHYNQFDLTKTQIASFDSPAQKILMAFLGHCPWDKVKCWHMAHKESPLWPGPSQLPHHLLPSIPLWSTLSQTKLLAASSHLPPYPSAKGYCPGDLKSAPGHSEKNLTDPLD